MHQFKNLNGDIVSVETGYYSGKSTYKVNGTEVGKEVYDKHRKELLGSYPRPTSQMEGQSVEEVLEEAQKDKVRIEATKIIDRLREDWAGTQLNQPIFTTSEEPIVNLTPQEIEIILYALDHIVFGNMAKFLDLPVEEAQERCDELYNKLEE